jgi:hypothetical protein
MRASKQAGPLVSLFAVDFLPPSGREAVTAESRRIISLKRSTEADGNLHLLETSCPGVFVIGDVRSGSVKHVAASVGEGAGRGGAAWFFGCSARQLVASWGRCAPFRIVSHPLTHLVRRIPRTVSSSTRLERRLLNRSQ